MILLGKRIRQARKIAGLTQEELADRLGVSRAAVARWELGEIEPKLGNIMALAVELNTSTDALLGLAEKEAHEQLCLTQEAMDALARFIEEVRK